MSEFFLTYYKIPNDFKSERIVATCYLEFNNKFLLVKRHPNSTQGNRWCMPGGKIESQETSKEGIIREVQEEVGLKLNFSKTTELGKIYIKRSDTEFTLFLYFFSFNVEPKISLNLREHTEAKWVTYNEAKTLPLIIGGLKTLDRLIYLKSLNNT